MKKPAIIYTILAAVGLTLILIVMISSCHTGNDPGSTDDLREDLSSVVWAAPSALGT